MRYQSYRRKQLVSAYRVRTDNRSCSISPTSLVFTHAIVTVSTDTTLAAITLLHLRTEIVNLSRLKVNETIIHVYFATEFNRVNFEMNNYHDTEVR